MNPNRRLLLLLFTALLLLPAACSRSAELDPAFLESDGMRLQIKGKTVLTSDPLTWQLGYNAGRKEFRVFYDDLSSYYTLRCNTLPDHSGQRVKADLEWSINGLVKRKSGVSFTVKQISDDGHIWLFSAKENIALTVQILNP